MSPVWALYIDKEGRDAAAIVMEEEPVVPFPRWTLVVEDLDGNRSAAPQSFNPWETEKVTVRWDAARDGYVCEFDD